MAFNNLINIWELHLFIQQILIKHFFSAKYSMDAADAAVHQTNKYSALWRFTANFKRSKSKNIEFKY